MRASYQQLVVAALAAVVSLWTVPAAAELALTWRAPPNCPSAEAVRASALRGAAVGSTTDLPPLEADALVTHDRHWSVRLRTRRGEARGERVLEGESCAAIADATAVVLALALVPPGSAPAPTAPTVPATAPALASTPVGPAETPSGARAVVPGAPAPVVVPPPVASSPNATPAPSPPRAREQPASAVEHASSPVVALGAFGAIDATTLPSPVAGVGGLIAWTPGRARIELGASAWQGASSTAPASNAGAELSLWVAHAAACYALLRGVAEVSPCAGAELDVVHARGFGAETNFDSSARWVSASGGVLVRVPLTSWLALRARADALVPLARPRFVVDGDGLVHQTSALGARASLGAEIFF